MELLSWSTSLNIYDLLHMNIPLESQDISLWIYIILEQLSSSYTLDSLRYCIYKLEIITKPNQTRVAKLTINHYKLSKVWIRLKSINIYKHYIEHLLNKLSVIRWYPCLFFQIIKKFLSLVNQTHGHLEPIYNILIGIELVYNESVQFKSYQQRLFDYSVNEYNPRATRV